MEDQSQNQTNRDKESNQDKQSIFNQIIKQTNCHQVLQSPHLKISKTKKICTLGPKSSSVQLLLKLMDNGMNVARLNFSHGTHQTHAKFIDLIKQVNNIHPTKKLSVLLDTKGPEIRTGKNQQGKPIQLTKGQQLQISIDYSYLSNSKRIACSYKQIIESVKIGSKVLFSDGQISSVVKRVDVQNQLVIVQILNNGTLGEKKNMCLPGCVVKLPTINPYDQNDIVNFGLKYDLDFIAVSFARYKSDIQYIRKILAEKNPEYAQRVRIISKIQNHQALQNIDQIIQASDGIMIARGDLGMQTPLQKIILLQKLITTKCLKAGKFVIVATQMVQSMQTKPRPTRAQVSDITNAVLDSADCIMASGQTANGQFPVQTVEYMNKICLQTQRVCDYQRRLQNRENNKQFSYALRQKKDAYLLVRESACSDIIWLRTQNLKLINWISSLRPSEYIFIFSKQVQKLRRLTALNYGVHIFDYEQYNKEQSLIKKVCEEFGFKQSVTLKIYEFLPSFNKLSQRKILLKQQQN